MICRAIVFLLFCMTGQLLAQDGKIHLGLHVSPESGWSESIDQGADFITQTPAAFGISAGIKGQYDLLGPLSVEMGILYRQRSFNFDGLDIAFPDRVTPTGFLSYTTSIYDQADLQFVSVPVALVLTLLDSWRIRAGVSADFLLNDTRIRDVENSDGSAPGPTWNSFQMLNEAAPVSLLVGGGKLIDLIAVSLEIGTVFTFQTHHFQIPFAADSDQQFSAGVEVNLWVK